MRAKSRGPPIGKAANISDTASRIASKASWAPSEWTSSSTRNFSAHQAGYSKRASRMFATSALSPKGTCIHPSRVGVCPSDHIQLAFRCRPSLADHVAHYYDRYPVMAEVVAGTSSRVHPRPRGFLSVTGLRRLIDQWRLPVPRRYTNLHSMATAP